MADRKPLISGNWKMHLNHFEAISWCRSSLPDDESDIDDVDVSVHPPFTDLLDPDRASSPTSSRSCSGPSTATSRSNGAFTGEVAPPMLAKLGVTS